MNLTVEILDATEIDSTVEAGGTISAVLAENAPMAVTMVSGGPMGPSGAGGAYVQPDAPTPAAGSGRYIWFQTDAGATELYDILIGEA